MQIPILPGQDERLEQKSLTSQVSTLTSGCFLEGEDRESHVVFPVEAVPLKYSLGHRE